MRAWAMDDPQLVDVIRLLNLNENSRVLDVGCDSGGLLESLIKHGLKPSRAYGIDPNAEAVEYGRKISSEGVHLLIGTATDTRPPFPYFTHVICVGTLMYTPQRETIQAIADAVQYGGYVILVYETMRADFMWMTSQGFDMTLRALRDFPYGVLTNLVWQPPESILGRRAFVSTRRTRRQLGKLGFHPVALITRKKGRPFLGKPTQKILVMQRENIS
jgi:SAM-dependent methyltransferase